jgi:hypothetical protein
LKFRSSLSQDLMTVQQKKRWKIWEWKIGCSVGRHKRCRRWWD